MGAWDGFESTAQENQFVQLKEDGDEFEGVIASIEPHVIPANTFDYQPEDLTVPRITFEDGKVYDATTTVVRNAFIELAPEPGTRVKIKREGKPKGKKYILYTVKVVGEAPKRGVDTKEEF
jgi:hypothetical protein